jgi:hypothetical protein
MDQPAVPKAPRWAGRVPRHKIARLYELEARGIVDEALLDDVGISLLLRCQDSLRATEAHKGRAPCPVCDARIPHKWDRETLVCEGCGWRGLWCEYLKSYQDKQLCAGGMEGYFEEFVRDYPRARGPREKLLLIDLLIHRFHREYSGKAVSEDDPGRPGCVNLIGGRLGEVMRFLDELTYGPSTAPELGATRERWREYVRATGEAQAKRLEAKKRKRGRR